jgi:hypothetical protein
MNTSLNLLPVHLQRWQLIRLRLLQWSGMCAIASVILCTVIYAVPVRRYRAQLGQIEARQRERARLEKLQKRLVTARARLADIQMQEGLILELGNPSPDLAVIGELSRAAAESEGGVHVKQFLFQRKNVPQGSITSEGSASSRARHTLTLTGTAADNRSVADFVAALRSAGVFITVDLKATGIEKVGTREIASYNLECVF